MNKKDILRLGIEYTGSIATALVVSTIVTPVAPAVIIASGLSGGLAFGVEILNDKIEDKKERKQKEEKSKELKRDTYARELKDYINQLAQNYNLTNNERDELLMNINNIESCRNNVLKNSSKDKKQCVIKLIKKKKELMKKYDII